MPRCANAQMRAANAARVGAARITAIATSRRHAPIGLFPPQFPTKQLVYGAFTCFKQWVGVPMVHATGCAPADEALEHMKGMAMKSTKTRKTLKATAAAAGVATVLLVPTGCASSAAGSGGLVGGSSSGCVVSALGLCV